VLVGLSRKTFVGEITGRAVERRLPGTLAAGMLAVLKGAAILRVHDAAETVDCLKMLRSLA
jgi:dihydropteroate synthase